TEWLQIDWNSDVPPSTSLRVLARSANAGNFQDPSWELAIPTREANQSPLDLRATLTPNWHKGASGIRDGWLWAEFHLASDGVTTTPSRRSLTVTYDCPH